MAAAPWLAWSAFAGLLALLLVKQADILIVCLIPLLLVTLACADNAITRFLASGPIMALGRFSYATNMLHYPLLPIPTLSGSRVTADLGPAWSDAAGPATFYCALLVLAAFWYRLLEVSGRALTVGETAAAAAINPHLP